MRLAAGTVLGPYEIIDPLGAGGMGEVYRARDTRLNRSVAVKILPASLAQDADFRARFQREAQVIASLNHPSISVVYDVGRSGDLEFIVMELIEGETLATRISRGALPLDEVRRLGARIAQALAAAHRRSIAHRDLKPGNVMLTASGVKVLDFGLAKALTVAPVDETVATAPATVPGMVLGTPGYMAPEQLQGRAADTRSDIYALGVILLEMATGQRDPLTLRDSGLPTLLRAAIERCLAADPDHRWQDAQDVAHVLDIPDATAAPRPQSRGALVAAVAVAIALAALAFFAGRATGRGPLATPVALSIDPEGKNLVPGAPSISPDGRFIAFAVETDGRSQLWMRSVSSGVAAPLEGTEGALLPVSWTADSRAIVFAASGAVRKVTVEGGAPEVLATTTTRGATVNSAGTLVYPAGAETGLLRLDPGGTPQALTQLDGEKLHISHRFPSFLPDGRRFLFFVLSGRPEHTGIYVGSLDGESPRMVLPSRSAALYSRTGHLLHVKQGTLVAQPVAADTLAPAGAPLPLRFDVYHSIVSGDAGFSLSDAGTLVYQSGVPQHTTLRIVDIGGRGVRTIDAGPGIVTARSEPALSPDGRRLALAVVDPELGTHDIRVVDLETGASNRVTYDTAYDFSPVWSSDGTQLLFMSNRDAQGGLYRVSADGGPEERLLTTPQRTYPTDWSPDGKRIIYQTRGDATGDDLWILEIGSEPRPLVAEEGVQHHGTFSPDGEWIAYSSGKGGRSNVFVRHLTRPGRWEVTQTGGVEPQWTADGSGLYYVAPDGALMLVPIQRSATGVRAGRPRALFRAALVSGSSVGSAYEVSRDGSRVIVNESAPLPPASPIGVLLNWPALLEPSAGRERP